jgi:cyclopropane-fatty-acyl-phospholipid synthase
MDTGTRSTSVSHTARVASATTLSMGSHTRRSTMLASRVRAFIQHTLAAFPWQIIIQDWTGQTYSAGSTALHWCPQPLRVTLKTEAAAKTLLSYNTLKFLDQFLAGDVDLEGNLYLLPDIRTYARFDLKAVQMIPHLMLHKSFQNLRRSRVNVQSHYDIPQEALNVYLDRTYMSYSCGMWEDPTNRERTTLLRIGAGEHDAFDSLEKAQWRKYKDAVDYLNPQAGETLLDVGCGYGGQLLVALQHAPFGKVVGWTLSANQVREGAKLLAQCDRDRWEIHEGDYREEHRVFDHITSTGMVCHVGPRGLVPYVRNIRRRIRKGGRYLHHCMMIAYSKVPHDFQVGIIFNKKYVWPGFHFFTAGTHVTALERNGFEVKKMVNLSEHYAKTTAAWYERMMQQQDVMLTHIGEPTFRAWQIFLAGITGSYLNKGIHLYRVYCEAV